jgi:hypothetical protein
MRVTIIPEDGLVSINGEAYRKIDLSMIDSSINAVQWYDADGEIEIKDARGRIVENRQINSFDEFAFVIPLWEAEKEANDLLKAQANVASQTS